MTIISHDEYDGPPRVVDLRGPEGNAYAVMGLVKSVLKQIGYDKDHIDEVIRNMMSSDYDHLIEVADEHIGHIYTFVK